MKDRVVDYIIMFFVSAAVLGILFEYKGIYPFKIALLLLFSYIIYYYIFQGTNKQIYQKLKTTTKIHFIFYFLFFYYFTSYFWIDYNVHGYSHFVKNLFKDILISLVMVYYVNSTERLTNIYKALSITFLVEIIFGLLQIYPDIYMPNSTVNYPSNTPTGFMYNRNDFGFVLGIIFPYALFIQNIFLRLLISSIIVIVMFFIGSLVAFSSIFIGFILYMIFIQKRYKTMLVLFLLIIFVLYSGLYKNLFPRLIKDKIYNVELMLTHKKSNIEENSTLGSTNHKIQVFNIMMKELKETNYLGTGAGQSFYVLEKNSNLLDEKNFSIHNFWIELLSEIGILGFIIFLSTYIYLIIKNYLIYKYSEIKILSRISGATFLSLIIFIISSGSPSSVLHIYPTWILFGIAVVTLNLNLQYTKFKVNTKKV